MFSFWQLAAANGSMNIENMMGRVGTPAWYPSVNLFVVTVAFGDGYKILTQLMNDSPNPNLSNVANKKFQFTLSNAFSASNVTLIESFDED